MSAKGVWLGNKMWPSGKSPGDFAKDVFRIENCKTDKEKALAFNKWFLRCMQRGPNLFLPSLGGYLKSNDPFLLFTSWAHNECSGWGWVAAEALQAAGLKARRSVAFNHGHTFYEVWYKGDDGKEGWHAFDPFIGWHFGNESNEVASCEELAANPDLVLHPRKATVNRLGHHPERSGTMHRYQVHDLIDVSQPVSNEKISLNPQLGQSYSWLWKPELPALAVKMPESDRPHGAHCDITLYDEEGKVRYPEHFPYWKNYVWPTPGISMINGGEPVRWLGSGALRWQPVQYGEKVVDSSQNAVFENGTIKPIANKTHCEVMWKIELPYLASYLRISTAFDTSGGDKIGIFVSPDGGKTKRTLFWGNGHPPKVLSLLPEDQNSIRNIKEFWIGMDMSSMNASSPLRLRGLEINVGYQVNMNLMPRLLPGQNELYLEAEDISSDSKLVASWAYTHPDEEMLDSIELTKKGKSTLKKDLNIKNPYDIIMRGVTIKCLPK